MIKLLFQAVFGAAFGWLAKWWAAHSVAVKLQRAQSQAAAAEQTVQAQDQVIQAREVRDHVDEAIDRLPHDTDQPQTLSDAPPGSAGGKLRDGGWTD